MPVHDRDTGHLRFPFLLRHVPEARVELAQATLPELLREPGQTWWELVDPAGGDDEIPVAVAVTADGDGPACVELRGIAPLMSPVLGQIIGELLAALRNTSAERVAVENPHSGTFGDELLRAGFLPRAGARNAGFDIEL